MTGLYYLYCNICIILLLYINIVCGTHAAYNLLAYTPCGLDRYGGWGGKTRNEKKIIIITRIFTHTFFFYYHYIYYGGNTRTMSAVANDYTCYIIYIYYTFCIYRYTGVMKFVVFLAMKRILYTYIFTVIILLFIRKTWKGHR